MSAMPAVATGDSGARRLTNRELQVLQLICDGYSTKKIAAQLGRYL